jgi:hypothetical protein
MLTPRSPLFGIPHNETLLASIIVYEAVGFLNENVDYTKKYYFSKLKAKS